MAYEDASQTLHSLGFEKVFERDGPELGDFRYMRPDDEERQNSSAGKTRSIWINPAGIVACMESYGMTSPKEGKSRQKLSNIDLTFQVSSGSFYGNHLKTSAATRGCSGGTFPLLHGESAHYKSLRVGVWGDPGLLELLTEIQSHAKFIPFDQWGGSEHLHIPNGFLYCPPVNEDDCGRELSSLQEKYGPELRRAFDHLAPTLPPALAKMMGHSLFGREVTRLQERDWFKVEDTIDYYSRTLEAAGVCWPKPEDESLLAHWSRRISDQEAPVDLEVDRVSEQGPGGVHYAGALVNSIGRGENKQKFLDLLSCVDEQLLLSWATVPDAYGMTLVSQIVAVAGNPAHATSFGLLDRAPPIDCLMQSIDILIDRIGADALSLGSSNLSVASLIRKNINEGSASLDVGDMMQVDRSVSVIEYALEQGVQWGAPTREDDKDFAFLMQAYPSWKAIGRFVSLWERNQLAGFTCPTAHPVPAPPRPRL